MDFVTPILAGLSFLWLLTFSVVVIILGFCARQYRSLSANFFSTIEIVSGFMLLLFQLLTYLSTSESSQSSDEFWVQFQIAMTLWLVLLSICHLLELRKAIAPPLFIISLGILNLRVLKYVWYLVTEYEPHW